MEEGREEEGGGRHDWEGGREGCPLERGREGGDACSKHAYGMLCALSHMSMSLTLPAYP